MVGGESRAVHRPRVAAVSFVGRSGAGKTTLLERLLPVLRRSGLVVGYLKSAHKGFDLDRRGKDSERLFRAGAERVGIVSPHEGALRFRVRDAPDIHALLRGFEGCDLVLVEGFKGSDLPRVEVVDGESILPPEDPLVRAVVSDAPDGRPVPRFARDDLDGIARFVAGLANSTIEGLR